MRMSLLPSAGEGGRRPDEGAAPPARRSTLTRSAPARGTRATSPGLGRGDTIACPFSPAREKVAEGRMRGRAPPCQTLNPHPLGSRPRDPSDLSRPRER